MDPKDQKKDQKKGQEKPLSPEIAKLSEKLAKDPKSRLFVPLAEEYLKSGFLDEAVMVLTDGLKVHPNFHAARATLGKVYLEKGQIAEAKSEFEQVIKTDPENLLAHRKLAKLYKESGQLDKARISCQAVLSSNPKDAEMKLIIEELDLVHQAARQRAQERSTLSMGSGSDKMQVEQTSHAQPEPGRGPAVIEMKSTETPPPVELAPASDYIPVTPADPAKPGLPVFKLKKPAETPPKPESGIEDASEAFVDEAPPASPTTEEITTEALADLYIKQGHYEKGLAIYRRLLAKDPNNQALFRKLDETVELSKLLTEGPKIKGGPPPAAESPAAGPVPAPAPSTEPPPAEPAPPPDRERQKMQKIQRLQLWLDSIKKGQDR
ncbi:MAG: tetratricopeptide repeat protein [Nitrospirae bacterium]|nr:tetratricopeptide repeat protein [Nitrospirota bacterium]